MALTKANLVIDYLHHSTPEHLEMLGVDPTRLPTSDAWRERFSSTSSRCSSCDNSVFGERANMHLHVAEPQRRHQGIGTECVRRSVEIYFQKLRLKSLFCELNAFNVGPNRTLQKVGSNTLRPT